LRHGLLVALTLLGFAAPARAADVTVAPAGGEPVTLSIAELEPSWDVHEHLYTVDGQQIVVTGISIDRLLDRAGVDPFGYGDVTVGEVVLTRSEMIDPEAFPEGRPVFWVDAEGSHFLKPGGERLTGPFTVSLAARGSLRVTARASRRRVEPGERVTFTARVEGGDAGVRVRWTFDDGEKGAGLRVRHAFDRPGTYKVVVGATSAADPTGASAIVKVRVGEPAEGPDREGGGTDEDEDAPESGPAPAAPAAPPGDAAAGGDAPRERQRSRPAPKRRQRANRRPPERGDEITGVLLDDFGEPASATTATARTGDPEPATAAAELPEEALVALLALAIVALGSWREARPA
jgi:hypothetical protein